MDLNKRKLLSQLTSKISVLVTPLPTVHNKRKCSRNDFTLISGEHCDMCNCESELKQLSCDEANTLSTKLSITECAKICNLCHHYIQKITSLEKEKQKIEEDISNLVTILKTVWNLEREASQRHETSETAVFVKTLQDDEDDDFQLQLTDSEEEGSPLPNYIIVKDEDDQGSEYDENGSSKTALELPTSPTSNNIPSSVPSFEPVDIDPTVENPDPIVDRLSIPHLRDYKRTLKNPHKGLDLTTFFVKPFKRRIMQLRSAQRTRRFQCYCGLRFSTKFHLSRHTKLRRHRKRDKEVDNIPLYHKTFHRENKPWKQAVVANSTFKCPKCVKSFPFLWRLKRHLNTSVHKGRKAVLPPGGIFLDNGEKRNGKKYKPYQCLKCLKRFQKPYELRRHLNNVHEGTKINKESRTNSKSFYSCDPCGYRNRMKKNFNSHCKSRRHLDCLRTGIRPEITKNSEDGKKLERIFCEVCNIAVLLDGFERHRRTWIHYAEEWFQTVAGGKITCPNCRGTTSPTFSTLKALKCHFDKLHRAEGEFKCILCNFKCGNWDNFTDHLFCDKVHLRKVAKTAAPMDEPGESVVKCSLCNKKFVDEADLAKHELAHKPLKDRRKDHLEKLSNKEFVYKCPICPRKFWAIRSFECHKRVHERRKSNSNVCESCGKPFLTEGALNIHRRKIHNLDNRDRTSRKESQKPRGENPPQQKMVKCLLCPKLFKTTSFQGDHMRRIHNKSEYFVFNTNTCKICREPMSNKASLLLHMSSVHGTIVDSNKSKTPKKETCPVPSCGKQVYYAELMTHLELCHFPGEKIQNGRIMPCSYMCGFETANGIDWVQHVESCCKDKQTKQGKCRVCNTVFPCQFLRLYHQFQEHPESRYNCEYCPRSFIGKPVLKRHLLSHPETRSFQCLKCGKGFRYCYSWTVHKFGSACNEDKESREAFLAKRREKEKRNHEKTKNFKCPDCGKGFVSEKGMENHQTKAH